MSEIERNIMPKVGARFFRDSDEVMFEFVVDPNNIIGPRPATAGDRSAHAEAYRAFSSIDMDEAAAFVPEAPAVKPIDVRGEAEPARAVAKPQAKPRAKAKPKAR